MGWSIGILKNTLEVTETIMARVIEVADDLGGYEPRDLVYKGNICFIEDHMEHMDYLGDPNVLKVLKEEKVRGEVVFASMEGDNSGDWWRYAFDGEGNCVATGGLLADLLPA
jgi:hypothetical protein